MIPFYQIDAFTDEAFKGNPACVIITQKPLNDLTMQNIAMEKNLSETVFLYPIDKSFSIRWFTPVGEVNLCGHATLASAFTLFTFFNQPQDRPITFKGSKYQLEATYHEGKICLDFPILNIEPVTDSGTIRNLESALNLDPNNYPIKPFYQPEENDMIVEISDLKQLMDYSPNSLNLESLPSRGLYLTTKGDSKVDFYSRCFFPKMGILEDPVTGSALCALASFWQKKLEKNRFTAIQASKREGYLELEIQEDRLLIKGSAVVTMKGEVILE